MKKLSFFLMAMLITFGVTNTSAIAPEDTVLWGENFAHFGTKTPSNAGTGSGTTIYDGASITYTQSSTNTKGYNEKLAGGTAPELLLSKRNQTWTISGIKTGGATEMSLTFLSNKTTFSVTVSSASLSVSGSQKKWTISLKDGETDPETFNLTIKNTGSSNARIDNVELKVTVAGVESGAETVELPVFSATEANFTETFNLTITSAEGTTLKYTLDNSNPKESETAVVVESNTATIAIPAKSTIVKAVAVKGDLVSGVKSMTYCYVNSKETAYTITEALDVYNAGLGLDNSLYIQGTVKSITEMNTTQYYNANYTITDGENDLYIFRGKGIDGANFTSESQLLVGDDLVIYGKLSEYQGNPQVAQDSKIISRESKTKAIIADDLTFDAIAIGAEVEAQTLTVTGANLTADITATLDNEKFTVTPATLPAAGGDLTITPAADLAVGEHTATLTLTSGETTKEVALSILVKDVYTITWSVNGETTTTSVVEGDKLVSPAAPEAPEACSEKVFVGWTAAEEVNADGSDIEWVTATTVPTDDATYYAVFALQEGEGSLEEGNVTMKYAGATTTNMAEGNNAEKVGLDANVWNVTANKGGHNNYPGLNKDGTIRLYRGDTGTNSIIVSNEAVTIQSVTITCGTLNNVKVLVNGNEVIASNGSYAINASSFVVTNGNTSGTTQVHIASIVINYTSGAAATYTDYSTTCEAPVVNHTITATAGEGGSVTGLENDGVYAEGTELTLTATPADHYVFVNWTKGEEVVSTENPYTFNVTDDVALVANFKKKTYTVTANATNGTVEGADTYEHGATATLTATPAEGYEFVNWTEGEEVVSTAAEYTFEVLADRAIVANFEKKTYTVTANATNGTVEGAGTYEHGATATLTATPAEGYEFVNWTEGEEVVSTAAEYTFEVLADRNLVANFEKLTYTVTATATNGTVEGAGTYEHAAEVTLTATANEGYEFVNWTSGETVVSTENPYKFTVTADVSLVANFTPTLPTEIKISGEATHTEYNFGEQFDVTGLVVTAVYSDKEIDITEQVEWTMSPLTIGTTAVEVKATYGTFSATKTCNVTVHVPHNKVTSAGVLDGIFLVSDTKAVKFSTGNLQYNCGTYTWSFAEEQYEIIGGEAYDGTNNTNYGMNVPGYTGKLDLFAWSCESSKYGVNPSNTDADYTGAFVDWGTLVEETGWYTLTQAEMQYLLNQKKDGKALWTFASIEGIKGLMLMPYNWDVKLNDDIEYGYAPKDFSAEFEHNVFTADEWNGFQGSGAAFLPTAGSRTGGYGNTENAGASNEYDENGHYFHVDNVNDYGYYWLNTEDSRDGYQHCASYLIFPGWSDNELKNDESDDFNYGPTIWSREKRRGNSVRLVKETTRPADAPTDILNLETGIAPQKIFMNGQLIIIKNGVQYNAQGQVVK